MKIQAATFAVLPYRLYTQHLRRMKNLSVKTSDDWDKPQLLSVHCLVENELALMEWEKFSSSDTTTNYFRGCERQGMGV